MLDRLSVFARLRFLATLFKLRLVTDPMYQYAAEFAVNLYYEKPT